jgi:hypothetical protein
MNMSNSVVSILMCLFLAATGCVSVDISKSEVKKAAQVKIQNPSSPFQEFSSDTVDRGWRNNRNGNTISYVSDCGNPYDPSLESIEAGVISGLTGLKRVSTEEGFFNDRASRQSVFKGSVDGIPSQVQLLVFKKNNCIYVLSYIAVQKNYDTDLATFDKFLKGFVAP